MTEMEFVTTFPGTTLQHTIIGITMSIILLISIFLTFYGYRFLRISIMFQSIMLGGTLGWVLANLIEPTLSSPNQVQILFLHLGFSLMIAMIAFFIALFTPRTMLFGIGFGGGIQLSSIIYALVFHKTFQSAPTAIPVIMISGIASGICSFGCLFIKVWHVGLTAWIGSFWTVYAISFFIQGFDQVFIPFPTKNSQLTHQYALYVIAVFCLTLLGILVQLFHTASGIYQSLTDHKAKPADDDESDVEEPRHRHKGHYTKIEDDEEAPKETTPSSGFFSQLMTSPKS